MPPKALKTSQSSVNEINLAKATNPPGIRVIEFALKRGEFYRDQSLVAGYLHNCPDTESLRSIVTSLSPLFEQYANLRNKGWSSTSQTNTTTPRNPVSTALFKFLQRVRNNRVAADLVNSENPEPCAQDISELFAVTETKV